MRKETTTIMKREKKNITSKRDTKNAIMKKEEREKTAERKCSDQIVAIVNQLFCHYRL